MKTYLKYFGLCVLLGAPIGAATRATATPACQRPVIDADLRLLSSTLDGVEGGAPPSPIGATLIRGQAHHELRGAAASRGFVVRLFDSEAP